MRRFVLMLFVAALFVPLLNGCGSNVEEGIPENIDMSKDYTPAAELPGINPKDARKKAQ